MTFAVSAINTRLNGQIICGKEPVFCLQFDMGPGRVQHGYKRVTGNMIYNPERGYGFVSGIPLTDVDRGGRDALHRDFCTSNRPFYFVVDLPEGNYEITITSGDKKGETHTTVKAESRRLMLEDIKTLRGEYKTSEIMVSVRTPRINDTLSIRLKTREYDYVNWDNKLTLEFNNTRPCVNAVVIKKTDTVKTLFLAGNSTVTDQAKEPWAAWGQMITAFFNSEVVVANYAESGEALKSFVAERRLMKVMRHIRPGDYLFIEFGHNDQKPASSAYVEAFTGYKEMLKKYICMTRMKNAFPVLITPMHRRNFNENGKIINTHGDYPEAMRQVAQEENVPLIDLNKMSAVLYEALGVEGSKKLFVHYLAASFPGQDTELMDNSHHSAYGAYQLAKCVVEGIKASVPDLAAYLIVTPLYNPSQPDSFEEWTWPVSPFYETVKPEGN
ncbi:MAG: rhamnogalacturonan acetylesterase [Bacteroidales bacterium]|nr:rhamnogalacturonan acetylesterase [Bacteroidales bacterium]